MIENNDNDNDNDNNNNNNNNNIMRAVVLIIERIMIIVIATMSMHGKISIQTQI